MLFGWNNTCQVRGLFLQSAQNGKGDKWIARRALRVLWSRNCEIHWSRCDRYIERWSTREKCSQEMNKGKAVLKGSNMKHYPLITKWSRHILTATATTAAARSRRDLVWLSQIWDAHKCSMCCSRWYPFSIILSETKADTAHMASQSLLQQPTIPTASTQLANVNYNSDGSAFNTYVNYISSNNQLIIDPGASCRNNASIATATSCNPS